MKRGRHGYPSQAVVIRAEMALREVADQAALEGYRAALVALEREVYSAQTVDDILRWLTAATADLPDRDPSPDTARTRRR